MAAPSIEILIGLDKFANTLLGGYADETISARCWRNRDTKARWKVGRAVVDWVALHVFNQADHCYKSYLSELQHKDEPPELRDIAIPDNK